MTERNQPSTTVLTQPSTPVLTQPSTPVLTQPSTQPNDTDAVTGNTPVGTEVELSTAFASFADANLGPLLPKEVGHITSCGSQRHLVTSLAGESWWYDFGALKIHQKPAPKDSPTPDLFTDDGTAMGSHEVMNRRKVPFDGDKIYAALYGSNPNKSKASSPTSCNGGREEPDTWLPSYHAPVDHERNGCARKMVPSWVLNGRHLFHAPDAGQWWVGDHVGVPRGYLLIGKCDVQNPAQLDWKTHRPMVWKENIDGGSSWLQTHDLTIQCGPTNTNGLPTKVTLGGTSGDGDIDEQLLGTYTLKWNRIRGKGHLRYSHRGRVHRKVQNVAIKAGDVLPEAPFGLGAHGAGVEQLQRALMTLQPDLKLTNLGYFGPETRDALIDLQLRFRLVPSGRFSRRTLRALVQLLGTTRTEGVSRVMPLATKRGLDCLGKSQTHIAGTIPMENFIEILPGSWSATFVIDSNHLSSITGCCMNHWVNAEGNMEVQHLKIAGGGNSALLIARIGTQSENTRFIPFSATGEIGYPASLLGRDGTFHQGHAISGAPTDLLRFRPSFMLQSSDPLVIEIVADMKPTADATFSCTIPTPSQLRMPVPDIEQTQSEPEPEPEREQLHPSLVIPDTKYQAEINCLIEMGFVENPVHVLVQLLEQHQGDVQQVLGELLGM